MTTQLEFPFTCLGALQAYNAAQIKHMDVQYKACLKTAKAVHTKELFNAWSQAYALNGGAEAFHYANASNYFDNVVELQNERIVASAPSLKRVKNNLEDMI